jgi:hypothetical protein
VGALAVEPVVTLEELLRNPRRRAYAALPETDALTEPDGLQEADLVDVRLLGDEGSLAILFDLRTALQFRMANTAVLVMRDVVHAEWSSERTRAAGRVAHYVGSSKPEIRGDLFALELVCLRGWRLSATASSAEFFVGDVLGLPEAPPNFIEDDEGTIAKGMPAWDSPFEPKWATFLDPPS